MPVNVTLLKDGRVSLTTYTDPLDMKEIAAASEKANNDYLEKATKPVHSIMDFGGVHRLPANILSRSATMARELHPMVGVMVIVTPNTFINMMAHALVRALPTRKILVCSTLDEAWAIIDKVLADERT